MDEFYKAMTKNKIKADKIIEFIKVDQYLIKLIIKQLCPNI